MASEQNDKYIIVITKDDIKYSGKLEIVDKVNSKLILSKVTKTFQNVEESLEKIEIPRNDIKELRTSELPNTKTENEQNFNAIPENKISNESENNNLNKAYDNKKDFFDNLRPMTNPELKQESKTYNQKNKDTFNLNDNNLNDEEKKNYYKRVGAKSNLRAFGRGRGGYNRGRYNNYNNNYGRQYYNNNYNNGNNYYQQNNNNGGYHNNRGKLFRGRGRGRRGFKNNFEQKQENNNKEQQEVKQENKEENK